MGSVNDRQTRKSKKDFGDGSHILYVNAMYNKSDKIGELTHDFICSDPNEMKVEVFAKRCKELKNSEKGAKEMGWFTEELLEEGRAEGSEKTLINLVSKGLLSTKEAAKELEISQEEFLQRAKEAGYSLA